MEYRRRRILGPGLRDQSEGLHSTWWAISARLGICWWRTSLCWSVEDHVEQAHSAAGWVTSPPHILRPPCVGYVRGPCPPALPLTKPFPSPSSPVSSTLRRPVCVPGLTGGFRWEDNKDRVVSAVDYFASVGVTSCMGACVFLTRCW